MLAEQATRVEELRRTEQQLKDAERKANEAAEKVSNALHHLGDTAVSEELDSIDPAGLDEIEAFHRAMEDIRARRSVLEAKLASLGEQKPSGDIDSLINGINILRQWFETGLRESPVQRGHLVITWLLIALTAAVGGALVIFVSTWWAVLLLSAGMAAVAALSLKKSSSTDVRITLQEQYDRLPLDAPSSWDRETAGKLLNVLERSLAEAREIERQDSQRKDIRNELEQLVQEEAPQTQKRKNLIERFGVCPDTSNLALFLFATNLQRYQEARQVQDVCQTEIARLLDEYTDQMQTINAFLTEFGEEPCDSYDMARVRSESINRRALQHREAKNQFATSKKNAGSAQGRLEELGNRKQAFFSNLSLEDDDDSELENRLTILSNYDSAAEELRKLQAQEAGLLKKLEHVPDILGLSIEEVYEAIERLQRMADGYKALVEKIADIRARVSNAGAQCRLEDAIADIEQAKDGLAERRDEAALAAAGNFLLDEVEAKYKVESQPVVLQQASKWLGMFTRGRYELRLGEAEESEAASFRAFDTVAGRGLALNELSRGTRMQMLLATRLAFAIAAERGTGLPFILDEVLSSTDPVRFRAIIECILVMVKDGRQVLYLTCQPSDAIAWHAVAEQMGIVDAKKIDLAEITLGKNVTAEPLTGSAIQVQPLPEPGDIPLSEYFQVLGVPRLDPTAGARSAHIAHFVKDGQQLHRLLTAGIKTYGQLESLASYSRIDAYVSDSALRPMRARACVLDAFSEAWQVGQGKAVSREVLLSVGVSESFIDRITDLACELNWDAKLLVEKLRARDDERTKGFRNSVLEEMVENLTKSGHLDTTPPLQKEVMLTRVLAAANDYVKQGIIDAGEVKNLFSELWLLSATSEKHQ